MFSFVHKMKTHLIKSIVLAALILGPAIGAQATWDGIYTKFAGTFLIYSNNLDEKAPPTTKDRRLSVAVEGALARKMYEAIGPDQKDACGASTDLRIRHRGDLSCTNDLSDKKNPYTCHFGLNLKTGKSIAGSTC